MKKSTLHAFTSFLILLGGTSISYGQGFDDIGALPPMPNLDLGDPERKQNMWQRMKTNRETHAARNAENSYTRPVDQTYEERLAPRVKRGLDESRRRVNERRRIEAQDGQPIDVHNDINAGNAVTASGSRLRPFGEEDEYWGDEMFVTTPEETLIELPPLPDLRVPEQVSWMERYRNHRLARFKQRKAEAEAKRREQELAEQAVVDIAPPDPSTALIQVQSQAGHPYWGNSEAPSTPNNSTLKPFDVNSSYTKDHRTVYRGVGPGKPGETWWERGLQPGTNADVQQPKWKWTNPFRVGRDVPETILYEAPTTAVGRDGARPPVGNYSAGDPTLDATPLTSNLRGIRVVPNAWEVTKRGSGSGLNSSGVDLPPKVQAVLESRIGRPLTMGGLNEMVREAVLAYRRSDMPVVDVLVPEQEVSSGVLQLVIIEGRLGEVIVEGASRHEGRALASQIHMNRGDVIRESQLVEDLHWINKHPTRQVDLVYSPGDDYGETDVILRSQQYKELSGYIAYENSGTSLMGESRALAGVSWIGPIFWDLNTILSYQFTTNFDNPNYIQGHSGVWSTYLPWRHQVTLLGAYVENSANFFQQPVLPTANQGGAFATSGENKQLSGRYAIPLKPFGRVSHELELGMDFKSSNSDLNFNQVQVFNTTSEIVQYSLGYNIISRDATGTWKVDSEIVNSPGNNTNKNNDFIFNTQRQGAPSSYTYGRVILERDQALPNDWTGYGRIQVQGSNSNLLPSETLGAGGYDSVRGFEQRVARGDDGIVGSFELRTPAVYPSNWTGFLNSKDTMKGLVFYDFASLSNEQPLVAEQDIGISSFGVGLRYQLENWFSLRVDYGVQVTDSINDGRDGRWHIGARASF